MSNVFGPPASNGEGKQRGKAKNQTYLDLSLFDFDVPDEVLASIPFPEPDVPERACASVLTGCVFNNCNINFGGLMCLVFVI